MESREHRSSTVVLTGMSMEIPNLSALAEYLRRIPEKEDENQARKATPGLVSATCTSLEPAENLKVLEVIESVVPTGQASNGASEEELERQRTKQEKLERKRKRNRECERKKREMKREKEEQLKRTNAYLKERKERLRDEIFDLLRAQAALCTEAALCRDCKPRPAGRLETPTAETEISRRPVPSACTPVTQPFPDLPGPSTSSGLPANRPKKAIQPKRKRGPPDDFVSLEELFQIEWKSLFFPEWELSKFEERGCMPLPEEQQSLDENEFPITQFLRGRERPFELNPQSTGASSGPCLQHGPQEPPGAMLP